MEERRGASFYLMLAGSLGILCGLIEGFLLWLFQELRWMNWWELLYGSVGFQQIWFSAALNLVLFLVLGLMFAIAAAVLRWRYWPGLSVVLLVFLTVFDWLDLSRRLDLHSTIILAIGVTTVISRWLLARLNWFEVALQKTAPRLFAITLAGAVAHFAGVHLHERWLTSRLPTAPAGAPNVLLIVCDTLRVDHITSYGYPRNTTPGMDQIAREGVLFENAYATASWTLPSHASMFTGEYPGQHGAKWKLTFDGIVDEKPVLPEILRQYGYVTGGFAANTTFLMPYLGFERGFIRYVNLYQKPKEYVYRSYYGRRIHAWRAERRYSRPAYLGSAAAEQINMAFLNWLDGQPNRPFFAFLNLMDAHDPSQVEGEAFRGEIPIPVGGDDPAKIWKLDNGQVARRRRVANSYDNAVVHLDFELTNLLGELRRRGKLESTIIILTSDHGELLGEHSAFGHGNTLYQPDVRVPLIISWPGNVLAGKRFRAPVSLRDLSATILDMATPGIKHAIAGTSLAAFWAEGEATAAGKTSPVILETEIVVPPGISLGWVKGIIDRGWKLILYENQPPELYNLDKDPMEVINLADTPEGAKEMGRLKKNLIARAPGFLPQATIQFARKGNTVFASRRREPSNARVVKPLARIERR